jgi:hypothetical protein
MRKPIKNVFIRPKPRFLPAPPTNLKPTGVPLAALVASFGLRDLIRSLLLSLLES